MIQHLLVPLICDSCGKEYWETGYWRDAQYCFNCSTKVQQQEDERKKDLVKRAADITEKFGLDLSKYPEDLPEDVLNEINPRNAGRKGSKYDNAYCELLIDEAAEGKTESEFAAEIKISQALLQNWTERHPRFKVAREIANEVREAWFEKHYRLGMLEKIKVNASMMIRYGAAKYGFNDKSASILPGGGGEIPVVKIVERYAGFPTETVAPTAEQTAAADIRVEGQAG